MTLAAMTPQPFSTPISSPLPGAPRVLHVVQPWNPPLGLFPTNDSTDRCDSSVLAAVEAIRVSGVDHSVLVLAGSLGAQRARSLGLKQFDRLAPPLGKPSLGARLFARYTDQKGPFDLVHLWGENLARLEPWHPSIRAVAISNLEHGSIHLLSAMGTRTSKAESTLPPLTFSHIDLATRQNTRARVREQFDLRDNDIALALIADPPSGASVARFTFLASLLNVSGFRVVAIVNSHGRETARGLSDRRRNLLRHDPIVVDDPLLSFLPACDIGVFAPGTRFSDVPEPATWRTRAMTSIALNFGVPVVTASTNLLPSEFESQLLADSSHPAAIARVIARLCDDPPQRAALRETLLSSCGNVGDTTLNPFARRVRAAWSTVLTLPSGDDVGPTGTPRSDLVASS